MDFVISILLFFLICCALFMILQDIRPMPVPGCLPIVLAAFVGLESIVLNGLSLFNLVNRPWVIGIHATILAVYLAHAVLFRKSILTRHVCRFFSFVKQIYRNCTYRLLIPLVLILALTALVYPPNNYDSMTYHMARVAHWIQNGSVDYYHTPIWRQNRMGPGAEYIILFFQIITGSDRLANCVQLLAYILLFPSLVYIMRIIKIRRDVSPLIAVICLTAPMALMQATSTQNDLVASVMTLAIIISSARVFGGKISRMTIGEYALAGLSIGSAFLVKPTAIVVSAPLLMIGLVFQLKSIFTHTTVFKKCVTGAAVASVLLVAVAGPDIARKGNKALKSPAVYPILDKWSVSRAWNPVRSMRQNLPFSQLSDEISEKIGFSGKPFPSQAFRLHEDYVGNHIQILVLITVTLIGGCLFPYAILTAPGRNAILLSLYPAAAWVLFSLLIRDEPWVTRLQLPLIFTLPFGFAYISKLIKPKLVWYKSTLIIIQVVCLGSLSYGYVAAAQNSSRPLRLEHFWGATPSRNKAYYKNKGGQKSHDHLLRAADKLQCRRIGLLYGGDSYDYPITWRAMEHGLQTRHVSAKKDSNWPCLLHVLDLSPKKVARLGDQWISAGGDGRTFYRNIESRFKNSKHVCLRLDSTGGFEDVRALHEVSIETTGDGFSLRSSGNDPQIRLPDFSCPDAHSAILRVELSSPADTVLQLFYRSESEAHFSEKHSYHKKIKRGNNLAYFLLPIDHINGPLRLDPGTVQGSFTLHSIEVRSL